MKTDYAKKHNERQESKMAEVFAAMLKKATKAKKDKKKDKKRKLHKEASDEDNFAYDDLHIDGDSSSSSSGAESE